MSVCVCFSMCSVCVALSVCSYTCVYMSVSGVCISVVCLFYGWYVSGVSVFVYVFLCLCGMCLSLYGVFDCVCM